MSTRALTDALSHTLTLSVASSLASSRVMSMSLRSRLMMAIQSSLHKTVLAGLEWTHVSRLDTPVVGGGWTSAGGRASALSRPASRRDDVRRVTAGRPANTLHADKDVTRRPSMTSRQTWRHVSANRARGAPEHTYVQPRRRR